MRATIRLHWVPASGIGALAWNRERPVFCSFSPLVLRRPFDISANVNCALRLERASASLYEISLCGPIHQRPKRISNRNAGSTISKRLVNAFSWRRSANTFSVLRESVSGETVCRTVWGRSTNCEYNLHLSWARGEGGYVDEIFFHNQLHECKSRVAGGTAPLCNWNPTFSHCIVNYVNHYACFHPAASLSYNPVTKSSICFASRQKHGANFRIILYVIRGSI